MNETVVEAAKPAPPVVVVALEWMGVTLSDLVLLLTAIYTILLIVTWIRRYLTSLRLSDKDPVCAETCPLAKRLLNEQDAKK